MPLNSVKTKSEERLWSKAKSEVKKNLDLKNDSSIDRAKKWPLVQFLFQRFKRKKIRESQKRKRDLLKKKKRSSIESSFIEPIREQPDYGESDFLMKRRLKKKVSRYSIEIFGLKGCFNARI